MDPKPQSQASPASQSKSGGELAEDVFGTKDDSEAMVVHGLLESAGIESVIVSLDAPQEVLPGVGGVVIRVALGRAEEARQLIEEYRTDAEEGEDQDDSGANGDSAA